MSEEGVKEEETYSAIFSALKHPVRRRILRMLREGPMTFTEILNALAISTGHLNFYLESLGDLITKTEGGKYRLSTFGVAALNLLKDVEEPVSEMRTRKFPLLKVFSVVRCLALLVSAGYVIQYTEKSVRFEQNEPRVAFPVYIEPNQTLVVNYTITYNGTGRML